MKTGYGDRMPLYAIPTSEPGTVWSGEVRWVQFAATCGAGLGAIFGVGAGSKLGKNEAVAGAIGAIAGAWLFGKYIRPN